LLVDGKPVALGARALDLLVCLIERRDRVVSKEELLQLVWPGTVVEENNLTVQISALRKFLGPQALSTVSGRGYRFTLSPSEPAAAPPPAEPLAAASSGAAEPQLPLPEKPSIAVLAFENMSGDVEQVHFCDGISEDIITDLSKISGLAVIGRTSTFAYKGKASDLRRVGRELGVRYILEGSVRKIGKHVRVTAQLVEAENGTHVWVNRYDRDLDDLFLVGDEVTRDIVDALDVKIARGEDARIWRRALRNIEARDAFMRGWNAYGQATPEGNLSAREMFLEVARLEPDSAMGYAYAGITHALDVLQGWSKGVTESLTEARRLGAKALEVDASSPGGHAAVGLAALFEGKYEEAMAGAKSSLEIRPMCASPRANLAYVQLYSGDYEGALGNAQNAIKFNPVYPGWYLYLVAAAQHFAGHYEEALGTLERVIAASPRLAFARALRIAALAALGRLEEAKHEAATLKRDHPEFTVERFAGTQPFRDKSRRDGYMNVLRSAGL
jgi:TolB-like protein/Flp pilus assembly protein TadD